MADVAELTEYYKNLLILQYTDLAKAEATIGLLAETVLAQGVAIDVQNAYSIDTAIGTQLDVIGKYVGVNRYFSEIDLQNYFALVTYAEHAGLPTSPPAFGLGTYATFSNYDYNGTLVYADLVTSQNALSDDNFRTLIKLAILRNNINFSDEEINAGMWSLFAGSIRPEETGNTMVMACFFNGAITTLTQAILAKGLIPKPMGVRMLAVTGISGDMFAAVTYAHPTSPFGYGFSTYANYDSLNGQMLEYSQISEY